MVWIKAKLLQSLKYIKHHKLTTLVLFIVLLYQVARFTHMDLALGHFDLVVEPVVDAMVVRYTGIGDEE